MRIKFKIYDRLDQKLFSQLSFGERFKIDMEGNLIHPKGHVCDGNYEIRWWTGAVDSNLKDVFDGDKVTLSDGRVGVVQRENGEWIINGEDCFETLFLENGRLNVTLC